MKNIILTGILLMSGGYAMADDSTTQTADSNDPCTVVMCMAGQVMGASGGNDCDAAISKFYSFTSYKKHHRFDASATSAARSAFLNQCTSADSSTISGIISKFGRVKR